MHKFAVAVVCATASIVAYSDDSGYVEEIQVIADPTVGNTPTFEQQFERFLHRPGAETVVSTEQFDSSHLGTLENLMSETPGVYSVSRGDSNGGLYSIRGTDIASSGPRNGRGIRAYIDGVPLGRTEAGLTVSLIDILAADYLEVYRGPNSLRFGAISAGGALNFVSRTGKNNPGSRLSFERGAYGFQQMQLQHGAIKNNVDYYVSLSDHRTDGYRDHTETEATRLSSNLGWAIEDNLDTRFFFTVGKDYQDLSGTVPLNLIEEDGRDSGTWAIPADTDRNFDYVRLANRTDWSLEQYGKIAFDTFALRTDFDHLPSPFSGIVDNLWEEYGVGIRYDHVTEIAGMTTEITGGIRGSFTEGEFLKFRHLNGGKDKGDKVNDTSFESTLIEAYGEMAFSLTDNVRLFVGLQAVDIQRELTDNFREDIASIAPVFSRGVLMQLPQPGSSTRDQGYDVGYDTINPKLGLNWQIADDYFLFASIARSYEVPTGADVADVVANGGTDSAIKPQVAWTYEFGLRGGTERFFIDATFYHSPVKDEILTRSCSVSQGDDISICADSIAFNVDNTVHQGVEIGLSYVVAESMVSEGDSLKLTTTWNYSDFKFDDDPIYGDNRLPVIPQHTLFSGLTYTHSSGFFADLEYRYADERGATYDGSGGKGWTIPSYSTWGMQIGFKPQSKPYSFYIQGTNLGDEIYASTYTAEPTQPETVSYRRGVRAVTAQEYANVRVSNGRAWYAGVTFDF